LNIGRQLLLTGEPLDAERAWSLGLVNELTDPGEALTEAMALAERICANSPTSVRETLRAVQTVVGVDDELGWQLTTDATAAVTASEDMREGISAFFETRPPQWSGR